MADQLDSHIDVINNALDTTDINIRRVEKNLASVEKSVVCLKSSIIINLTSHASSEQCGALSGRNATSFGWQLYPRGTRNERLCSEAT